MCMLCQPQRFQQFIYIQRPIAQIGSDLDIFPNGQIRNLIIHLKYVTQVLSAIECQLLLIHIGDLLALNRDASLVCLINSSENSQMRRFAGTGWSQLYTKLSMLNGYVDTPKYFYTAITFSIMFFYSLYLQKHKLTPSSRDVRVL